MGKSTNIVQKFGKGYSNPYDYANFPLNGSMNTRGLFWGSSSNGSNGNKVFGIENLWSAQECMMYGLVYIMKDGSTSVMESYIKMTYGTEDGSNGVGYYIDDKDELSFLNSTTKPFSKTNSYIKLHDSVPRSSCYPKTLLPSRFGLLFSNIFSPTASDSTYYTFSYETEYNGDSDTFDSLLLLTCRQNGSIEFITSDIGSGYLEGGYVVRMSMIPYTA